jgi:KRAB domain-containing zinc finger protein
LPTNTAEPLPVTPRKIGWPTNQKRKKKFKCNQCESSFTTTTSLWNHKHMHAEGPDPFVCDICGKSFKKPLEFKQHLKLHGESKKINKRKGAARRDCVYCGKNCFQGRSHRFHLLQQHRDEYLKDQPYLCEVCIRPFASQTDLDTHSATHVHRCKFCPRVFEMKAKLLQHERTHTQEKPFICDICGKAFTFVGNCRDHRMRHTGERPFWCSVCPEKEKVGFFKRKDLEKHMAKVHPDLNTTEATSKEYVNL